MKNINRVGALILLPIILLLSSCKKDISLDPLGFQTTDVTNEAQLTNQLAGVYSTLEAEQLYGWGMWGYFNAGTDEGFNNGVTANSSTTQGLTEGFRSSSDDASYLNLWKTLYSGIERANVLLSVINQPVMNETKRANIKGQALFLRAYYFYLLVNNFGDVPYKTKLTSEMGSNFDVPETPSKAIYDSIIKDMSAADTLVQTITQAQYTTTVTQSAVEAILARVCLSAAGSPVSKTPNDGLPYYKQALFWAEKLIASNNHSLYSSPHPQYSSTPACARTFINNMQDNFIDKNLTEGIWDAAFLSNGVGSYAGLGYPATQQLGVLMGITCPSPTAKSTGTYRPLPSLYNLYGNGDQRRDWVFAPYLLDTAGNRLYNMGVKFTVTPSYIKWPRDTIYKDGKILRIRYDTTFYGSGAVINPVVDVNTGAITSVNIVNGGAGYLLVRTPAPTKDTTFTACKVGITSPSPGSTSFKGVVTLDPSTGSISNITVAGTGYVTVYDRPVAKWRREYEINLTKSATVTSSNFPIIRYADVLLMAAEADIFVRGGGSNAFPTGVEYYNQVKRRAYGFDPKTASSIDVSVVTIDSIMAERSRELCFEGQRRSDLKRWGLSVMINALNKARSSILSYNAVTSPASGVVNSSLLPINNFLSNPQKFTLFPIPSSELALEAALSQNPGW